MADDVPSPDLNQSLSVDVEFEDWKQARKRSVPFAWRQISFTASICFGLAAFVLPASVNDFVQWPLYVLAIVSFYTGLSARRRNRPGGEENP